MPLHLLSSNRIEILQEQLSHLLLEQPLSNVLASETVLVPSMAMQRWLNLQLAQKQGVAANIDYQLPASWVWQVAAAAVQEGGLTHDPLSREQMAWQILALLPQLVSGPSFEPLRQYLQEDVDGVKAWQLAQKIADVFDRYQFYRPDWIRLWSNESQYRFAQDAAYPEWQPLLWQALLRLQTRPHRVQLIDQLLADLDGAQSSHKSVEHIPERVCCFALSSVPPLFMDVLEALSRFTDVYLLQHSPSDQYWADLRGKTQIARIRVERPDEYAYYDSGNELLASWGRQGQAFQDLLLSHDSLDSAQMEAFDEPGSDTLLHRLQQSILELNDNHETIEADNSLELRICHSPLRECQVLHDALLHEFNGDATLKPEDVLVIVPEISRYAPYIEAIFRKRENEQSPFIPWNLSDISIADEHPLIQIFFRLLALPSSRFNYSEIMSYLEVPEIASRFDIGPDDLSTLSALFSECDVRWGIDGQHKREFDLPATEENTWRSAIARLWTGFAIADTPLWEGIAAVPHMGDQEGQVLGRFCAFFEALVYWRQGMREARTGEQWQVAIGKLLSGMFISSSDGDERQQKIREELGELYLHAANQVLSHEVVVTFLQEKLGSRTVNSRFFSGGVTFCGMRPMRSLPFRVICILGMQDTAFPRRDAPIAFDGMVQQPRLGDPRKADEDRYLLLETLLCARDKLYISYIGKSLKDNSDCQPSVLLRELIDYIDQRYRTADEKAALISEQLTRIMPMQAFSERNYLRVKPDADERSLSYDQWWSNVATALRGRGSNSPGAAQEFTWPTLALAAANSDLDEVDLASIIRFFDAPVKSFFNSRLRIFLHEDEELEDDEVFSLSALEEWSVNKEILDANVGAENRVEALDQLQALFVAQGRLPHGARSGLAFDASIQKLQRQFEMLEEYRGVTNRKVQLQLFFNANEPEQCGLPADITVNGKSGEYFLGLGLLSYTPSKLRAKVFLRGWIEHLMMCAENILGSNEVTRLICLDGDISFPVIEASRAKHQLRELLHLYFEGQLRPLAIFPNTSFVFAQRGFESANAVRDKWVGNSFNGIDGDMDNPYVRLVVQDQDYDPLGCAAFEELARAVYGLATELKVLP
jgi:exodeoxyribonuclease V gamma subunit